MPTQREANLIEAPASMPLLSHQVPATPPGSHARVPDQAATSAKQGEISIAKHEALVAAAIEEGHRRAMAMTDAERLEILRTLPQRIEALKEGIPDYSAKKEEEKAVPSPTHATPIQAAPTPAAAVQQAASTPANTLCKVAPSQAASPSTAANSAQLILKQFGSVAIVADKKGYEDEMKRQGFKGLSASRWA